MGSVRRPVSRVLSASCRGRALDGHSSGTCVAARLARPTRATGRESPCVYHDLGRNAAGRPYSVLLPVGFTLPPLLPRARCALTAPFHPFLRSRAGGLFSVALSLGSPPPAVSRHRFPVEPGLSSTPRRRGAAAVQPPDTVCVRAGCAGRQAARSRPSYSSSSGSSMPASGMGRTDPRPCTRPVQSSARAKTSAPITVCSMMT